MKISLDVRIMAVPERADNVEKLKSILGIPAKNIFYDYDKVGNFKNARRAWLFPTDKTHVLVLQDDIEVCDSFLRYVETTIKKHPKAIISYFSLNRDKIFEDTPYIKVLNKETYGLAVSIPTKLINKIWMYNCDPFYNPVAADDTQIKNAAQYYGINVIQIVPNLVQHKDYKSIVGNPKGRPSRVYIKDFSRLKINWKSNKIHELWE